MSLKSIIDQATKNLRPTQFIVWCGNLVLCLTSDLCDPNCSRADLIVFTQLRFDEAKAAIAIGFSGAGTQLNLVFTRVISISTNPT